MKIDMNAWKREMLQCGKRQIFPIMTHPGIEMIGKKVYDAVTDGAVHAEAVQKQADVYPSIASSVMMDLTVEAEAFGAEIRFSEHEVPSVVGRLVSDRESIGRLQVPTLDKGRVPEYIKANRLIAAGTKKPVVAGCIGPYSLAGRLYDMSEIMVAMFVDPDSIKLLLEKCTEFITLYCLSLKEAGANAVLLAEPAAGLLSNEACREFSSVYVKQLVGRVQSDDFLVFLHNCGNMGQCTEAMVYTGAAGYHFGNAISMPEALKDCPDDVLVMGNMDPVALLKMGSEEEVYAATMSLLEETAPFRNFILSTGCDTPPEVPFGNIERMYEAVQDFNAKQKQ